MIKSKQVNITEESKIKGVDKYELNVPLANNKYRGGNPISYQNKPKDQLVPSNDLIQTPIFCGFGSNQGQRIR